MRMLIALSRPAFALFLAVWAGCAHVSQKSESAKRAGLESSTLELQVLAVELGRESMGQIEIAADSIDAGTNDIAVRRNTLYLRLSSVPAITEACLRPDPVAAMLDLYAFRLQMANFVASPAGRTALGSQIAVAERAIARNAARWESVATSIGAHVRDDSRSRLASWVAAHPINGLPFTRTSLVGALASTLREQQTSLPAAVGGIQESLDRLEFRISFANDYAVKQAMWLAQLAALDMSASPDVAELRGALLSTGDLIEDAPNLMARERTAALSDVDRQRRETLAALTLEFDRQRVALLDAVASERALVLSAVDEQRRRVVSDADTLRMQLVADEMRVVDHLMLRLAELSGALLVAGGVGWLLLRPRV